MIARRQTPSLAGAAALMALVACGGGTREETPAPGPDRIVATVNGEPITARRLERSRYASRLTGEPDEQPPGAGEERRRMREDLRLVIDGELLYQAARAAGVRAAVPAIDEQLEVARSQFGSDEEFLEYLDAAGLDETDLREEAERRLVMEAYAKSITGDLVIDESRARAIYEERKEQFSQGEQVRVAQIIVRALPHQSGEKRRAARRRIEEAWKRLMAGENFAAVAAACSESPHAGRGGDLGFFPRGRMLPEFEKVAFVTPVGETSPIFETPHGYNIIKVLDRRAGGVRAFDEVKTALLMVLAREQRNQALRDHVAELRAAATIRVLDPELAFPE